MSYTPPLGSAVDFNFTTVYAGTGGKPPGNSIIFNFGGVIGPISTDANLPIAKRQAMVEEDEWFQPYNRRRFAPPEVSGVLPYRRFAFSMPLYQQVLEEPEQFMFRRTPVTFIPTPLKKRAVLFVVT